MDVSAVLDTCIDLSTGGLSDSRLGSPSGVGGAVGVGEGDGWDRLDWECRVVCVVTRGGVLNIGT